MFYYVFILIAIRYVYLIMFVIILCIEYVYLSVIC